MTSVLTLGLRLAWGTREQRLRSVAVAVASALGSGSLLLVWAIARDRLLGAGAFHSEAGFVVVGAVLMVALPVVAMVATVARLQTRGREERLANLRRLGLSAARTRLVAAVEVGVASATGVLLGIPLYLGLGWLTQRIDVTGQPWNPYLFTVPTYGWVGVLLGVLVVAVLVAAWPPTDQNDRSVESDRGRTDDVRRPGLWRLGPLLLGLAVCGWSVLHTFGDYVSDAQAYVILVGVALAGFGLLLAAPVLVRLVADVGVKVARGPVTTIATRRLQARPGSVLRVVATLMAVLVVLAGARGVIAAFQDLPQYEEAERSFSQEQVAEVSASAAEAAGIVATLNETPGVERVIALPMTLVTIEDQDRDDESILAAVATCAELKDAGARVPDCVEGRLLVGDSRPDLLTAKSGTVTALTEPQGPYLEPPDELPNREGPSAGLDLSDAVTVPADDLYDWGVEGGVHLVIPPDAAEIGEVVAATDRQLVVHGPPGRGLTTTLDQAGIWSYSAYDTADYDFGQSMLFLMWALAAVLFVLGLFTVTVALVDRAAARRQENASLRALGTSPGVLRRAQFLEAVVPVLLGTVSAVLVGWFGGNAYLSFGLVDPLPVPWLLLAGSVLGSFVVAGLTVFGIGSDSGPEDVRRG
ncbi:FtsX-like permease family protein [Nocardioides gilvus]|uniref:FtsX-like permease family protein n=1 Tax=Nocardioides gilvus TaxID=1735589 RepID=UPI000D743456|nr:FtsX-like permease family protein [Nocardioides gilvus]